MEYDKISFDYERKYSKRMDKKMKGKPEVVKIIMSRTFSSAIMILQNLENIPFGELTFAIYDFCVDVEFKEVVRLFDAELELAGIDPEKFIFDLHPFYNGVSNRIKKENKYREFAEFIGMVIRLRNERKGTYNEKVVDAYLSLVFQMLEYLRKDKFDLTSCAYGVSTDGDLLMGPYPLPYSDLPALEYKEAIQSGRKFASIAEHRRFLFSLYQKRGIPIRENDDLEALAQVQKIHISSTTALFPFINEFTFDIVALNYYHSDIPPFRKMRLVHCDIESLKSKLQHRNYTLPTNGTVFEVSDRTGEIVSVLLREVVYHDCVYMLYRIDTDKGSLSGYYDTKGKFLFAVIQDATSVTPYSNLCGFVLSMYATQVLADMPVEALNDKFIQNGHPLTIKPYRKGGKLRNQYLKDQTTAASFRNPEDYNKEERNINVIIRKLPEGMQASEEAKKLAAQYGYDLGPGQTFVRPFTKQVFVKKNPN